LLLFHAAKNYGVFCWRARILGEIIKTILPIREPVSPIRISLVTEDFVQKQNVLEYSLCICFLVTPSHKKPPDHAKKQMCAAVTAEDIEALLLPVLMKDLVWARHMPE